MTTLSFPRKALDGPIGPPRDRGGLVKNLDFPSEGGCRTLEV
jgi:hypothetical protein